MKTLSKDLLFSLNFLVIVFVEPGVAFDEDNETLEGKSYFEEIQFNLFFYCSVNVSFKNVTNSS